MLETPGNGDSWSDPRAFTDGLLALLGPEAQGATPGLPESVREMLASVGQRELDGFLARLQSTGKDWGYHPSHALARALSRIVMRAMLGSEKGLS